MDHPVTAEGASRGTVLVVDDDADALNLFSDILADEGYDYILTKSFDQAEEVVRQRQVRVVVADCVGNPRNLVRLTGLQRLRRVRPGLRVILCTACWVTRTIDPKGEGLFDIVERPFDIATLVVAIQRALN